MALVFVAVVVSVYAVAIWRLETRPNPAPTGPRPGLTLENYDRIRSWMTIPQVEEILGPKTRTECDSIMGPALHHWEDGPRKVMILQAAPPKGNYRLDAPRPLTHMAQEGLE